MSFSLFKNNLSITKSSCEVKCKENFIKFFFKLLKFTLRKKILNKFMPVIAFSKRDYLLVWKLVEYTLTIRHIYVKAFIAKEANKL